MSQQQRLAGRVAVVTGAGRGLGQFVAMGLAATGVRVAVVARTGDEVQQTCERIRASGSAALPLIGDVSQPDFVERIALEVHRQWGPASILINAAGIFGPIQPIVSSDPRRWIETLAINVIGPYLTCRAFLPGMLAARWGRIIDFSSAAALHPPGPLNSAYATSKVALNHFTRHLAAELTATGVSACVIHPGEVQTAMWAAIRDEAATTGDSGAAYRRWAADVGASGGDPPQKALDFVREIIDRSDTSDNGKFLWIHDGIQTPIPSW